MNLLLSTWTLLIAGLVFGLPMLYLRVKNHTDYEDEALARMDDEGNIRPVSAYQNLPDPVEEHSKTTFVIATTPLEKANRV